MATNITEEHRRAFEALTSGDHRNLDLFSCFIDGAPGAAIVAVNECPAPEEGREPEYTLQPVFVSVTPAMRLTDHDERKA